MLILLLGASFEQGCNSTEVGDTDTPCIEDTDNDGLCNDEDEDDDNDGILDNADGCPREVGVPAYNGCPPPPPEPDYDEAWQVKTFPNNSNNVRFDAPPVNGSRYLSIAGIVSMDNGTDDDGWAEITPDGNRSYKISTGGGNSRTKWGAWTAIYELPSWANVKREILELQGAQDVKFFSIPIPSGHEGIGIIEFWKYKSNGDDDAYVLWRTWSVGNHIFFAGATGRGNAGGQYAARCTVVHWEKNHKAIADRGRVFVRNNSNGSLNLYGCEAIYTALTAYMTEDVQDKIDEEIESKVKQEMGNTDLYSDLSLALGFRAQTIDPNTAIRIINVLRITIPSILSLFGNDFDDDVSAVVEADDCGATMRVFDGNSKSGAEMSVWKLDFNP